MTTPGRSPVPRRRAIRPPRSHRTPPSPATLVVAALVVAGLLVVLGPALVGQGVLLDVNSLSRRLPFRAVTGAAYFDAISCRQDTIDYFPAIATIRESILAGHLPTWAPYEVGGAPLASQPNSSFLTPLALPYFVLPLWLAPAFVKLGEVVVGIAGMIAFLRRRGVSWTGSWLAGFVFVTSGFMIMWSNWPQTRVAALIPALMWAVDKVIDRHRAQDAVVLALVFAAMLLGGFPAVTLYAVVIAGVYALVRVWVTERGRPLAGVWRLATAGAGLLLGGALACVQMIPFVLNLSSALAERDKAGERLPLGAAITVIDPSARGTCRGGTWFGDVIPIEAVGYVGCAAVVLAFVALGARRNMGDEYGTRPWLLGSAAVLGWMIWIGPPLLWLFEQVPVIGNNSISRAQSVLGFLLACLAGLGFDRVVRTAGPPRGPDPAGPEIGGPSSSNRPVLAAIIAAALLMLVIGAAVVAAVKGGYLLHLAGSMALPLLLLVVSVAIVRAVYVGPRRFARGAPLWLVVLVVVQGTVFAHTMLPLSQRDLLYPETPVHEFLRENIGHSRYGAGDGTMDAAISDWYRLRSPTGHEFTDPRWKDLLRAVDPNVERSGTYTAFSTGVPFATVAQSKILDRLAVRYWTANPRRAVGRVDPPSDGGHIELGPGAEGSCRVPGGGLRGIGLRLAEKMPPAEPGSTPTLHVRVSDDKMSRTGSVLLDGSALGPGPLTIAVAGEDLADDGRADVEVWLTGTDMSRYFAGDALDDLACTAIRPPADGADRVRLVFADSGAAVYERQQALSRIRWASHSRLVEPDRQVDVLQSGVPDDTVLLDDDTTPAAGGGRGSVTIVADEAERIVVETDATDRGYVVVADSIVRAGWTATIDGEPAPIVRADHAFAGVSVSGGRHRVELSYAAPGLRVGTVVSILSVLVAGALVAVPAYLRRRRGA